MGCGASKNIETVDTPAEHNGRSNTLSNQPKTLDVHHQQFLAAAKEGNFAQVKKFAGIVDLNVTDEQGNSAIILATMVNSSEIVQYLVDKRNKRMKAADLNHQNDKGFTALHIASKLNGHSIIRVLLDAGALSDITDRSGKIPKELSSEQATIDIFEKNDAESDAADSNSQAGDESVEKNITELDENDYKEWITSAMLGDLAAVRSFVDIKKNINVDYNDGWSALLCAAQRDHYAICEYLLSVGAVVDQTNDSGCNVLHLTTSTELCKLFVDKKCPLDAQNTWGDTPLHDASWHGRLDIVKILVENGADINSKNNNQATPLHHAAKYGREEVVKYLLEKGAESSYKDQDGNTPLDYAVSDEMKHLFMIS